MTSNRGEDRQTARLRDNDTKAVGNPSNAPPPGAEGQVWVNTASHVCRCPVTKYYGNTKKGLIEVAAKTADNHADQGKACP